MYASLDDMILSLGEDRLLRIADRDRDGVIDDAVVRDALSRAASEIDSSIGGRYRLPMANIPEVLRSISIDLAHYHLDLDPTDDLRGRAKDARASLRSISKGESHLADAELAASGVGIKATGPSASHARVQGFKSGLDMSGFD